MALKHSGDRYLEAASCHEEDAHLLLPTIGMTGRAIRDPCGHVEYGQGHLIRDVHHLVGKFAGVTGDVRPGCACHLA